MLLRKMPMSMLERIRKERFRVGQEKYGDKHLKRDNLWDVMEELLDAENILNLAKDRYTRQLSRPLPIEYWEFRIRLNEAITYLLYELSEKWPDVVATDEEGGERIGDPFCKPSQPHRV